MTDKTSSLTLLEDLGFVEKKNILQQLMFQQVKLKKKDQIPVDSISSIKSGILNIMELGVAGRIFSSCDMYFYDEKEDDLMCIELNPQSTHVTKSMFSGLLGSVCQNDFRRFRLLKNSKVRFNYTTFIPETQKSLLHVACERGSIQIVKELVEGCKVPVNIRCYDYNTCHHGMTPLHAALMYDNRDIVKYLLKKKAKKNLAYRGVTAGQIIKLTKMLRNKKRLNRLSLEQLKDILARIKGRFMLRSRIIQPLLKRIGQLQFLNDLKAAEKKKAKRMEKKKRRLTRARGKLVTSGPSQPIPVKIFVTKKSSQVQTVSQSDIVENLKRENDELREILQATLSKLGEKYTQKPSPSVEVLGSIGKSLLIENPKSFQQPKYQPEVEELLTIQKRREKELIQNQVNSRVKHWIRKLRALSKSEDLPYLERTIRELHQEIGNWSKLNKKKILEDEAFRFISSRIKLLQVIRTPKRIRYGEMTPLKHSMICEKKNEVKTSSCFEDNDDFFSVGSKENDFVDIEEFEIL